MTSGFAEINGARLYYEISGDGPPLVLLHAGIGDSTMWDDQFPVFARHYRVLRYDQRGFGQSQPAAGQFSHHEDLRALLDQLEIERAFLLGCSMGGSTATDFVLTYPGRAAGLILVGAALGGFESTQEEEEPPEWAEIVQAFRDGDYERVSEFEVRTWVDGPSRQPDQVDAAIRDKVRAMNVIALRNEASGIGENQPLDPPAAQRLSELKLPVLVMVGDLDQPEMLEIAGVLAAQIDGAQKVVMSGTAHVPNMEQPETFNRLVLDWLNDRTL